MYKFLIMLIKLGQFALTGRTHKAGLTSHLNFKYEKFANLASKIHGSVSPEAPTSAVTKVTSIEALTNTTNNVSSSITLLTYVSTTVSSSADPSTSSTSY